MPRNEVSEEMASKIDAQVRSIALKGLDRARALLREHRVLMDHLVDVLLERETVDGEEFRQIVSQYTQIPEKFLVKTGSPA
jgi:cell division protease FtsH